MTPVLVNVKRSELLKIFIFFMVSGGRSHLTGINLNLKKKSEKALRIYMEFVGGKQSFLKLFKLKVTWIFAYQQGRLQSPEHCWWGVRQSQELTTLLLYTTINPGGSKSVWNCDDIDLTFFCHMVSVCFPPLKFSSVIHESHQKQIN